MKYKNFIICVLVITVFLFCGCSAQEMSSGKSFSSVNSDVGGSIKVINARYSKNKIAISKNNKTNIIEDINSGGKVRINSVEGSYSEYSNHMYLKLNCTVLSAPKNMCGFYAFVELNDKSVLDDSLYFMSGSLYEGTNCTMDSSFSCRSFTDTTFYLNFDNDYAKALVEKINNGEVNLIK